MVHYLLDGCAVVAGGSTGVGCCGCFVEVLLVYPYLLVVVVVDGYHLRAACYCLVLLGQGLHHPCLVEVVDLCCCCLFDDHDDPSVAVVDGVVVVYCDVEIDLMLVYVGAVAVRLDNVVN